LARQGRLKVLGLVNDRRVPIAPDVPTIREAGGPVVEASVWYPMYAPARTPPEVINRLSSAIGEIVRQPEVADSLDKQGLTVSYLGPADLGRMMRQESTRWAALVKERKLSAE
jgi:tripartite-type tricarboxylate transporter receptor subunit TctC